VAAWLAMLKALKAYVKAHHTTGLAWNSAPGSKAPPAVNGTMAQQQPSGAPPPPPGGPPPPPPPPPPMDVAVVEKKEDASAKLFAQLNQGVDITKCSFCVLETKHARPLQLSRR